MGRKEGDMPHEKINHPKPQEPCHCCGELGEPDGQLVLSWNAGWTQISIYPQGWSNTGDAHHVTLPENELDLLIKTLKRAKRRAYADGHIATGFEPTDRTETEPLWPNHV